jgi:hypothetical protein
MRCPDGQGFAGGTFAFSVGSLGDPRAAPAHLLHGRRAFTHGHGNTFDRA